MTVLDKQFVFIIGAPRSGSTWLQAMLGAHPVVSTHSELQLYGFYTAPWIEAWKVQVKNGGFNGLPTVWSESELYEFLREFLDRVYSRVLATKPAAVILLDKHPGYSEHVEHIEKLIPNSKFIDIIRDGRDVVGSLLEASQGWGMSWAPKDVENAASLWKRCVLGARNARQYGDRYLEVRYEELLTNGIQVLRSIFEFMGLSTDLAEATSIYEEHRFEKMRQERKGAGGILLPEGFFREGRMGGWQRALGPTQRYALLNVAGDLLSELGYATDSWWVERSYQYVTVPLHSIIYHRRQRWGEFILAIKNILGPKWFERARAFKGGGNKCFGN